jgi:hypothetical protein
MKIKDCKVGDFLISRYGNICLVEKVEGIYPKGKYVMITKDRACFKKPGDSFYINIDYWEKLDNMDK